MRTVALLIIGLCTLAGCKSDSDNGAGDSADLCGASDLQVLVGQPFSDTSFDEAARIIRPGTAVTQDFRPDRLNVELDENDVITRIACG